MNRWTAAICVSLLWLVFNPGKFASGQDPQRPETLAEAKALAERRYKETIATGLEKNCFACHSDKKATAGLNLQQLKPDFSAPDSGEVWRSVYERIRDGEMPPPAVADVKERIKLEGPIEESVVDAEYLRRKGRPAERKHVPVLAEDSAAVRLQKRLRNIAATRLDVTFQMYLIGRVTLGYVNDAQSAFLQAELALAETKSQRIEVLRSAVETAREIEDIVHVQFANEIVDGDKFALAKAHRLGMQLQLQKELDQK